MRALVTGGGGFLGGAVVRALRARGDEVVSLSRGDYPWLRELGVRTVRGDVAHLPDVLGAADGCEVVLHVAARAGISGPAADYRRSNVLGTDIVIAACRRLGIGRLVHTSSPSVVHAGGDIAGGDETLPYAAHYTSPYPQTKAAAERAVLAANGPDLSTVALRPHLVWGPGDTQLTARLLDRARSGRLRLVAGGTALIDTTYIEDAATAHLLAADAVRPGAACAGRVYFISAGDPRPVREVVNGILGAAALSPVTATVPLPVAEAAGLVAETVWRLLRRDDDPPMTRFLARQLATAHWFDISAARRDLGYTPRVPFEEGLRRLAASLRS